MRNKGRYNMDTEVMIAELRHLEEKHKNDKVYTFDTNWSLLCYDVANRLEELVKELEEAIKKKDDLQEKYMNIAGSTDKFISENALRRKLDDMRLPYLESVFGYNGGYNAALDDISSYLNGEEN